MYAVRILLEEVEGPAGISTVKITLEGEDQVPETAPCLAIAYEMLALFQQQLDPVSFDQPATKQ